MKGAAANVDVRWRKGPLAGVGVSLPILLEPRVSSLPGKHQALGGESCGSGLEGTRQSKAGLRSSLLSATLELHLLGYVDL